MSIDPLTNFSNSTLTGGSYVVDVQGTLCLPGAVGILNANVARFGGDAILTHALPDCEQDALANLSILNGTLSLGGGQTQAIASPLTVNGTLAGWGNVIGDVINNGSLRPGSVGPFGITGDYTQTANGELGVYVFAPAPDEVGALNVDGSVSLDGDVVFLPGNYKGFAQPGDTIPFLNYIGTRSGSFASWFSDPPLHDDLGFEVRNDDVGSRVVAIVKQALRLGRTVRHVRLGAATQFIRLAGDGTIRLAGRSIQSVRSRVQAGLEALRVEPKGGKKERLNRRGHLRVRVHITYTPRNGDPIHQTKRIRLVEA